MAWHTYTPTHLPERLVDPLVVPREERDAHDEQRGGHEEVRQERPAKRLELADLCSAMQCNAMQCNATQCNAVQRSAPQCNAVQCSAMQCDAVQCNVSPAEHLELYRITE